MDDKLSKLITHLNDSLQLLDEQLEPYGLYGVLDAFSNKKFKDSGDALWRMGLQPALKCEGIRLSTPQQMNSRELSKGWYREYYGNFKLNLNFNIELVLYDISFIKVTKFGNRYRVDKRKDFRTRWEKAGLVKELRALNKLNHKNSKYKDKQDLILGRPRYRIVYLVGYDRWGNPFEKEMQEIENELAGSPLPRTNLSWKDRYQREFSVLLAAWWTVLVE